MLKNEDNVGVFIDWENLRFSLQIMPRKDNIPNAIDWTKFKSFFDSQSKRVRYHLYGGHSKDLDHLDFVNELNRLGFNTMFKKSQIVVRDGQGANRKNADIEIAVDALLSHMVFDHIVIFSGDGDFTYLVEHLKKLGVWVTVVSYFEPPHKGVRSSAAKALMDEADNFVQLRTFLDLLEVHDSQALQTA
jgi:uncharacterized LabA/DUF88 family protein